jgi:hypothetical protein
MRQSDWFQVIVSVVAGGIVTAATTVLGDMILSNLQTRDLHLVYSIGNTKLITEQAQTTAMYDVSISNEGKEAVEEVDCIVQIPSAIIEQKEIVAAPAITHTESVISDTMTVRFPWLNPSEKAQLKVLAIAPSKDPNRPGALPNRPEVSLRGKGVSGVERSGRNLSFPLMLMLALLLGFIVFVAVLQFIEKPISHREV